jgi:hypothetical protein
MGQRSARGWRAFRLACEEASRRDCDVLMIAPRRKRLSGGFSVAEVDEAHRMAAFDFEASVEHARELAEMFDVDLRVVEARLCPWRQLSDVVEQTDPTLIVIPSARFNLSLRCATAALKRRARCPVSVVR